MLKIRQRGAFKPYGSAVSVIEHALWDIAGKAAGVPVYKLLGGKVRDKVRVYNGAIRVPFKAHQPEDYAEDARRMKALPEGFTIVKQGISFHQRDEARSARTSTTASRTEARSTARSIAGCSPSAA